MPVPPRRYVQLMLSAEKRKQLEAGRKVRMGIATATMATALLYAASAGALEAGDIVAIGDAPGNDGFLGVFDPDTRQLKDIEFDTFLLAGPIAVEKGGSILLATNGALFRIPNIHGVSLAELVMRLPQPASEMISLPSGGAATLTEDFVTVYLPGEPPHELLQFLLPRDMALEGESHLLVLDGRGRVLRLNTLTGVSQVLGSLPIEIAFGLWNVALQRADTLVLSPRAGHIRRLFRFDLPTGNVIPISDGEVEPFSEMVVGNQGRVFAIREPYIGEDHLFEIDPYTGDLIPFAVPPEIRSFRDIAIVPAPEPGRGVMAVVGLLGVAAVACMRQRGLQAPGVKRAR